LQDAAPPVSSFKYQVSTSSLSSAIANALALNPTEDNPVLIQLGPGVYTIYDLRFTNYDLQFAVDTVAAIADRGEGWGFTIDKLQFTIWGSCTRER